MFFPARFEKITEKSSSLLRYQDREGFGGPNHHALACGRCTKNRRKLPLFVYRRERFRIQEFQLSSYHSWIHASGNVEKVLNFHTRSSLKLFFDQKEQKAIFNKTLVVHLAFSCSSNGYEKH